MDVTPAAVQSYTCNVRAMVVSAQELRATVVSKVVPAAIVNKSIVVIINFVVTNLALIDPLVPAQVQMVHVNAGIDNSNHNFCRTSGNAPSFLHFEGVVVALLRILGIVWMSS
uniref:Uncharacterized protein n=1 Tax=Chrysotila carterae TaxID=13221 RepID=A0A6T0AMM4_CHRCT